MQIEDIISGVDIIICATHTHKVLHKDIFALIPDGAFVCNMSQNVDEIDTDWLYRNAKTSYYSQNVEKITLQDSQSSFYLISKVFSWSENYCFYIILLSNHMKRKILHNRIIVVSNKNMIKKLEYSWFFIH